MLFTRHVARYRVTAPDLETRYDFDRVWNRRGENREEGAFQKNKGGPVDSRRCEGAKASGIRHRLTQFYLMLKSEFFIY